MTARFLSPALQELASAAEWYESKAEGLGDRFLRQVDQAVTKIEQFPDSWKRITTRHRRYKIPNYPYELIYEVKLDEILICAVRDQRSDWESWKTELEDR